MRFSPVGLLFDDGKKITPVADVEDQVYLLTRHSEAVTGSTETIDLAGSQD